MDFERDIRPISDFKRHTPALLKQLRKTGAPVVLTIKGKAEAVLMSPAAYHELAVLQERLETVAALRCTLNGIEEGQGVTLEEVLATLDKKYGLAGFQ